MEVKWAVIVMVVLFGGMFAGLSVEKYQQNQCRIASVQAGKSADDIAKICK
jgi:hypothetical protein